MKTMLRNLILTAVGLILILTNLTATAQEGANTIQTADRIFGLAKVWEQIATNSVSYAHQSHLDFDSLYQAYIPLVIKSASDYEYYRTLQRFAATMNEAGTRVAFPGYIADSITVPPVIIREIRGRFYITNIDKRLRETIPIGSEVLRVNGYAIRSYLDQEVIPYISATTQHGRMAEAMKVMLEGWVGSRVLLNCLTPDGRNINEMVERMTHGKVQWLREPFSTDPMSLTFPNRDVAVVRLNMITPATIAEFPDARQLSRAKVLIIDLRGNNHAQSFNTVASLVFQLTNLPYIVLPAYATRAFPFIFSGTHPESYGQLNKTAPFRHVSGDTLFRPDDLPPPLSLPIALITGPETGNGAEHFLMLMKQAQSGIQVFGERTAGSTGFAISTELPGGGKVWVNIRYDNYVEDDWFREGYLPDVNVPLDLKSLLNGEDLPLNSAIRHLQQQ